MNNRNKFYLVFLAAAFSLMFGAPAIFADTSPVVTSFAASASSVTHGYGITFSWTASADNFSGVNFYFTCPSGVTILNADGSVFPCNLYGTIGSAMYYNGAAFFVKNVSGATQTVSVKVVPKNYGGTENSAGALQTTFTVTTIERPITDFVVSASPLPLGSGVTLSWTGHDIPGANLEFDCVPGIHVISVSPAISGNLPCGTTAYASDLGASGSVVWSFANDFTDIKKLTMYVLPAIAARIYDAAHGLSLTRDVAAKADKPVVTVNSFTASADHIASGGSATFSWSTTNATGGNLQAQCSDGVIVTGIDSPATTTPAKLLCNRLLFSGARAASGSAELFFTNTSGFTEQVAVTFLPQNSDGTYDATKGKTIALAVMPPLISAATSTATGVAISTPSVVSAVPVTIPPTAASASTNITRTFIFTAPLYFGMRGSVGAVTELQKFLAQDPTLYPEGLTTGYFGPLTELAVRRFQKRYGLAQEGDAAFGFVGPKTRAKLNTLESF